MVVLPLSWALSGKGLLYNMGLQHARVYELWCVWVGVVGSMGQQSACNMQWNKSPLFTNSWQIEWLYITFIGLIYLRETSIEFPSEGMSGQAVNTSIDHKYHTQHCHWSNDISSNNCLMHINPIQQKTQWKAWSISPFDTYNKLRHPCSIVTAAIRATKFL